MAYETILYSVEDGVATLTLNRPEVQNGFNIPVFFSIYYIVISSC